MAKENEKVKSEVEAVLNSKTNTLNESHEDQTMQRANSFLFKLYGRAQTPSESKSDSINPM